MSCGKRNRTDGNTAKEFDPQSEQQSQCLPKNSPMDAWMPHIPPFPDDPVGPPLENLIKKLPYRLRWRSFEQLSPHSWLNSKVPRGHQGQCWSCVLQRNPCEFESDLDSTCIACERKREPSLLAGFIRIRLPDITSLFLPESLVGQYEPENFRVFTKTHVRHCTDNYFDIFVTWSERFRAIKIAVTEMEVIGNTLRIQNQYRLNLTTNQFELIQVPSPLLGLQIVEVVQWRSMLDHYVEDLLRKSSSLVPDVCFQDYDCTVESDFLRSFLDFSKVADGRALKLVHLCLKLVVLTYIMTRALTVVEKTRDETYEKLKNPPRERFGYHSCPRFIDKQMKFLMSALHRDVLKEILSKIQGIMRITNRKAFWASFFVSMTILATTIETLEATVRYKEEVDKQEGLISGDDETAARTIAAMDDKFDILSSLFHQAFRTLLPNGFNPVCDLTSRATLDDASQSLAAQASEIIQQHHEFLVAHRDLPPPSTISDPQTGRLLARFLLMFFPPPKEDHHHLSHGSGSTT